MDREIAHFSFEEAYARLEEILQELNTEEISLENSLQLYEEANRLISLCTEKLNRAEQKIQAIAQNRNGAPILDHEGAPQLENFEPKTEKILTESPPPS